MSAVFQDEAPEPTRVECSMSAQQLEIINSEAKVQWIGTGTKTGKTTALAAWIADGIQQGENTGWVGPWAKRTRTGYKLVKDFLQYDAQLGECKSNDSAMRVEHASGGAFEPFSGENPESIFGDGFTRMVIDEASRQKRDSLTNALTTVSATDGQVKLAFNLEHGAQNWAIQGFLAVRAMTKAERLEEGEDWLFMTTAQGGYVKPEVIERMRRKMPVAMFEALYNGIIPESDMALFHNLKEIFSGPGVSAPERGHVYIAGIDLARKANYTVCSILDVTEITHPRLVAATRFNEVDWSLQYKKLADFTKRWTVLKSWVDATGIGDPVVPALKEHGMIVEPFIFTKRTRKELLDGLIIACDGKAFRASDDDQFENHKHEMQVFGYELDPDDGEVTYGSPENENDDCVMSLALAWFGKQNGVFGRPMIQRIDPRHFVESLGVY